MISNEILSSEKDKNNPSNGVVEKDTPLEKQPTLKNGCLGDRQLSEGVGGGSEYRVGPKTQGCEPLEYVRFEGLSTRQAQAAKEFVTLVNRLRDDRRQGPVAWTTAVRFLMARKFDVRRALALYEQHEIVRETEGLTSLDPANDPLKTELETAKFSILPGRDPSGAAIAIFTARRHHPSLTNHSTTLQAIVYQLDAALDSIDTQKCGLVFVYDMSNSKYSNFDYELSQKMLDLLKGGYPARLKKVLIVTAPLWFRAPFKILRLFVREKLRERVYTVDVSQLSVHIPMGSLPRELGGHCHLDHKAWLLYCHKSLANKSQDIMYDLPLGTHPERLIGNGCKSNTPNRKSRKTTDGVDHREKEVEFTKDNVNSTCTSRNSLDSISVGGGVGGGLGGEEDNCSLLFSDSELLYSSMSLSGLLALGESNGGGGSPEHEEKHGSANGLGAVSSEDDALHQPDSGLQPLTLPDFVQYVKDKGRRGLYAEYAELKNQQPDGTFDTSKLPCNQNKNRYTDVLCYDHSRVVLTSADSEGGGADYINANYVDGYRHSRAYICTQGPLQRTYEDFWRMVWEQHTLVIVMTTRVVERDRTKCGQYWPVKEDCQMTNGQFTIITNCVEQQKDYIYTAFTLTNTKTDETREIVHLQFTSWPDYGVPDSAMAMLDFLFKVRDAQRDAVKGVVASGAKFAHAEGPPIVVHCSAGIGRTGTFCTLDICLRRLVDMGKIDVKDTVEKIRSQRAFSIQMPDQYVFCHLAVLEYAVHKDMLTNVDLAGFDDIDDSDSD